MTARSAETRRKMLTADVRYSGPERQKTRAKPLNIHVLCAFCSVTAGVILRELRKGFTKGPGPPRAWPSLRHTAAPRIAAPG